MFDLNGNVIGINSQILSTTGGNVGIGLAIPAEEAKPVIDQLMKGTAIKRGYLGVLPRPITDDIADALGGERNKGEIIRQVEHDTPAEKAGLKQGDVVMKVGNKDVTPDETLSYLAANVAPGTRVPLEIIRDGKRQTITVTMGTRPSEEQLAANSFDPNDDDSGAGNGSPEAMAASALGVAVTPLTPQIARTIGVDPKLGGVVVVTVDPSSDAAGKGVQRGDVIVSVNRAPVASAGDIAKIVAASKSAGRGSVLLYIQRRNIGDFIPVQIAG
jgi:serine protease Do